MTEVLDIPGQRRTGDVLTRAVAAREIGHALAFLGQPGLGQDTAARGVAAALNCPVDDAGCGRCHDCRRALRGAHPAYTEFLPTGAVHRVAEVREQWLPAAFTTAATGAWKVLRVRDADRMNDASANAFLKGLEEPPPRTTWILDIADPDDLPDTILSRCRIVTFKPWGRDELQRAVAESAGDGSVSAELLARVSLGNPERLRDVRESRSPDGAYAFVAHRQILRRLRDDGPGHALVAARGIDAEVRARTASVKTAAKAELAELDELYGDAPPKAVRGQVESAATRREREARTTVVQTALDDVAVWLRDVLAVAGGADPAEVIFFDDPEGLRADAEAVSRRALLAMLDLVLAARASLEFNVQQQLALESLFLQMSTIAMTA
jgi:DNA polymerase-3 subunit delta'